MVHRFVQEDKVHVPEGACLCTETYINLSEKEMELALQNSKNKELELRNKELELKNKQLEFEIEKLKLMKNV